MMKQCTRCGVEKVLTSFHQDRRMGDGRASACAQCFQAHRKKIPRPEYHATYFQANRGAYAAVNAKRRAAQLQRTPSWSDQEYEKFALGEIYECARLRSEITGVPHEVDHTVPLQGENVSGLHVAANLKVITRSENRRKSNVRITGCK